MTTLPDPIRLSESFAVAPEELLETVTTLSVRTFITVGLAIERRIS